VVGGILEAALRLASKAFDWIWVISTGRAALVAVLIGVVAVVATAPPPSKEVANGMV
jgi:hypothetical protein